MAKLMDSIGWLQPELEDFMVESHLVYQLSQDFLQVVLIILQKMEEAFPS